MTGDHPTVPAEADWITRMRMGALGLWGRGADSPGSVVSRLVAMQAQEHPYARWSVAQRVGRAITADIVDEAYDDGALLRTHVLRPTWHYVAPGDLRWLLRLTGPRVIARSARRHAELELDDADLARADDVLAAAVADGPRTRHELGHALDRAGISPGGQRLPHLLMHAELMAVICSGPRREGRHTYVAFDDRLPGDQGPDGDEALFELTTRYVATRGPVTVRDFVWWSGLDTATARRAFALASDGLASRTVDDRVYWFSAAARPVRRQKPRIDLVQCYDEAIISYRESRDVLHAGPASFPVPGSVDGFTHVLLLDGFLLGRWRAPTRGTDLEVETRIDIDLTPDQQRALSRAVDRYRCFRSS